MHVNAYNVTRSYLSGMPSSIEFTTQDEAERKIQAIADNKKCRLDRPPVGLLTFDWSTDQCDARFRNARGKTRIFMTIMAAG